MRYLILSDVHANSEALEAVLEDSTRRTWDRCLVLGDLVGYGADPNPVLDRLRELAPDQIIRGNHDKVVSGVTDGSAFNPLALAAALWTREVIRPENRRWLEDLPAGPLRAEDDEELILCHGSPLDEEAYILGVEDAEAAFEGVSFRFCLFGHTHYPLVIGTRDDQIFVHGHGDPDGGTLPLEEGTRYLVNPGSIGQPRDGNPRASYLILDTDAPAATYHRVEYPVEDAMAKITDAGLPAPLALRLTRGI